MFPSPVWIPDSWTHSSVERTLKSRRVRKLRRARGNRVLRSDVVASIQLLEPRYFLSGNAVTAVILTAPVTDPAATSISVSSSSSFKAGNALQIDGEILVVTGVNTATNQLDVQRGQLGTVAASHPVGADVSLIAVQVTSVLNLPGGVLPATLPLPNFAPFAVSMIGSNGTLNPPPTDKSVAVVSDDIQRWKELEDADNSDQFGTGDTPTDLPIDGALEMLRNGIMGLLEKISDGNEQQSPEQQAQGGEAHLRE